MLPIRQGHGIDDVHSKPAPRSEIAQNVDVARAMMTDAVIVTDQQLPHSETPAENELDEIFGGVRGKRGRERNHREVIDSSLGNDLEFFVERGKEGRCRIWIHYFERMRIEAHENTRHSCRGSPRNHPPEHIEVATMHAVECADRHDRSGHVRRQRRIR